MDILALDLSLTGTGVVYDGQPQTITTKLKDEERLGYIADRVNWFTPELVILEGLAYGTQTGKAMERAGLHYIVRLQLWYQDIPFVVAPPTTLKKYITGKGNAGKDEVMIAAVKQLPMMEIKNNNEADAAVLFAMAKDWYGEALITVPKVNRSALDKIEWPISK